MVAIKNVVFAASCVASALAAPSTKRQDWGNGGQVGGWGSWGQSQGQAQGQDTGASTGSGEVASVPITNEGQSSGSSGAAASVPITNDGQSSSGSSTAANSSSSTSGSTAVDSSAGSASLAAVSGETLTSSSTGTSGDYYYSHWVENNSGASMTVGSGSYSLEWTEASGNIVSGIGWNPASAR
jgi:hypothetical protein